MALVQRAPSQRTTATAAIIAAVLLVPALLVLLMRTDMLPAMSIGFKRSILVMQADSRPAADPSTLEASAAGVAESVDPDLVEASGDPGEESGSVTVEAPLAEGAELEESVEGEQVELEAAEGEADGSDAGNDGGGDLAGCPKLEMVHLDEQLYQQVQADPGLVGRDPSLLKHFEPAPWLLPARTKALPYVGVHDLDELIKLRSQPQGPYKKAVGVVVYSAELLVLLQNCIYTMVKFGEVTNYVVGTLSKKDMEACMDLNLPCADVRRFLPAKLDSGTNEPGQHNWLVLKWLKTKLASHILQQGYAVFYTDPDLAYTSKPIWASYLNMLAVNEADVCFELGSEISPASFVMLPTPGGKNVAKKWAELAPLSINHTVSEKDAFQQLANVELAMCSFQLGCLNHRNEIREGRQNVTFGLVRTFWPPQFMDDPDTCAFQSVDRAPLLDPCHWLVMVLNPLCTDDMKVKRGVFGKLGFWFLDDEAPTEMDPALQGLANENPTKDSPANQMQMQSREPFVGCPVDSSTASRVQRCHLLRWRQPDVEDTFLSCTEHRLALTALVAAPPPPAPSAAEEQPAAAEEKPAAAEEQPAAAEEQPAAAEEQPAAAEEQPAAEERATEAAPAAEESAPEGEAEDKPAEEAMVEANAEQEAAEDSAPA